MHVLARLSRAVKAVSRRVSLLWGTTGTPWTWSGSAFTTYNGPTSSEPRSSSVCEAVVGVIARTFPESPVHVLGPAGKGKTAPVENHALARLVAQPNAHYAGEQLMRATIGDWYYAGNAYWFKKRSAERRVAELWWLPAAYVEPASDDDEAFVQYYRYTVGGKEQKLDPRDVVHFRNGLDSHNPRRGRSPFASVLSEIFQDNEAARFGQALLANMGVPGVVLSPADTTNGSLTEEEADAVKQKYKERFGGDRRGDVLVMTDPWKAQVLAWSPDQLDLTALRRVPEERISAVVGVSAMVVGLGVGLEHSIYSNYDVAYQALYETLLIPLQRLYAGELQTQLLPDLGNPRTERVAFDNSQVRVLQPDLDALWKRYGLAVDGALVTPNEAREALGLPPLQGADVLYVSVAKTPTPPADLVPPEPEPDEEPALPPPTELRALPPPKQRRRSRTKARDFAAQLHRQRARLQPAAERDLARYFAEQAERAAAELVKARSVRTKAVPDWESERDELNRLLARYYARTLGATVPLAEEFLGVSFELDDPQTRAYLQGAGANVVGITETTRTALAEALQAGQAQGESVDALAKRIRSLPAFSPARARTVARTELALASQSSALASYRASGVVLGVRIYDGDGCGLRAHDDPQKADGLVFTLAEIDGVPLLAHPNCFVSGTMVLAPHLTASFARHYDGEIVVVRTADDDLIACTPNHPVLTRAGWVAAGALREGADVLRCPEPERMAALLDPDDHHRPAPIEQVADTVGPARGGTSAAVPTAAEAFHGDGAGSQVHVVRTDRRAEFDRHTGRAQPGRQPQLVSADAVPAGFPRGGSPLQTLDRIALPAASGVGGAGARRVHPTAAQLHADLLQTLADDGIAHPERLSDTARRFTGLVAASKIVQIERKAFTGHVYNLETAQNWYVAGGIIAHNCVRAFSPVTDAADLGANAA